MSTTPDLLSLETLDHAADCLRTIAHPLRLRMIEMLEHGRYSVGELAAACEIPSPQASEHLRLMERCRLLTHEREGRQVFYRIHEDALCHILACIRNRFA